MQTLLHGLTAQGKPRDRAVVVLNLLLLALIAYTAALLTWQLLPVPAPASVAATSVPASAGPAPDARAQKLVQELAALHLFGEVKEEAPPPPEAVPETAPDTSLNLTLRGVFAAEMDTADSARAIIAGADGKEDAFAVGDTLPGNATLKQIYADRVILQHKGRFETLRLPKDEPLAGAAGDAGRGRSPATGQGGGGETLRSLREQIMNNPADLLEMVKVAPVPQAGGGGLQGYRLMPGRDRQVLRQLGLRPGDVVTSVNGVALTDPAQGPLALQSLSQGEAVTLSVQRNGVEQQISIDMDQALGP